ncbi:short-chain fatty acid transporter, partial [Stenotrophomonas maltophilia]
LPFTETIDLCQSIAQTAVRNLVSRLIARWTAPAAGSARTAADFPGAAQAEPEPLQRRTRPGEWLEYSPL